VEGQGYDQNNECVQQGKHWGAVREPSNRGRRTKEMLKMQDDPDELLKTKGEKKLKNIKPDG
jgi:hypothetical protein